MLELMCRLQVRVPPRRFKETTMAQRRKTYTWQVCIGEDASKDNMLTVTAETSKEAVKVAMQSGHKVRWLCIVPDKGTSHYKAFH